VNIDLSTLSTDDLKQLSKKIAKEIRIRTVREAKEAERVATEKTKELFLQMRNLAAQHGMSIEDVIAGGTRKRHRRSTGPASTGPKSPPKYRNPKDPEKTWSGKGRKPGWIVKALEKGKKLKDFEI
jgi:DNA-binding protein H-NS